MKRITMRRRDARGMGETLRGLLVTAASGFALLTAANAAAQNSPIEVTGEMSVVTGAVDGEAETDADASIEVTASHVLDNGIEVGAVGSVRADADQPANTYAGGRYSSLLSGGARGTGPEDGDVFLEGAYLFARGGFGSVHIGRDAGAASRLAVTSPNIFRSIGVNDWRTDLTGLNDVHTINDFSGQATKVTYMPPPGFLGGVIGQLQLGVSYAPELEACGSDGCAPVGGYVSDAPLSAIDSGQRWEDVVEAALYYQKDFRVKDDPLLIGLSASYVRAEDNGDDDTVAPVTSLFGDYEGYSFGLNLAYRNLTLGGSMKSTNAGLDEDRDEDYLAFDAGVTYEAGEWNFMLGYGNADAERDAALLVGPSDAEIAFNRLDRATQTAQAGVSYAFDHGITLGAAAQFVDSLKDDEVGGDEDAAAVMFESSIKF